MNKEVSLKSFVIVMTVLVIIEIILLFVFSPRGNLDNYSSEY